jgi:hypothetical protein
MLVPFFMSYRIGSSEDYINPPLITHCDWVLAKNKTTFAISLGSPRRPFFIPPLTLWFISLVKSNKKSSGQSC